MMIKELNLMYNAYCTILLKLHIQFYLSLINLFFVVKSVFFLIKSK
jgi:hypothetical protein